MSRAVLVITYTNGVTSTEFLPRQSAVAWADRLRQDDRVASALVLCDDLTIA